MGQVTRGSESWTLQSHPQGSSYHIMLLLKEMSPWVGGGGLSCSLQSCVRYEFWGQGSREPTPGSFSRHPGSALPSPRENPGWTPQICISSPQATPWLITTADPSPPSTRTRTQPSPTVLCPTRGLSGTRTVTVST